jgi:hypothetical protein
VGIKILESRLGEIQRTGGDIGYISERGVTAAISSVLKPITLRKHASISSAVLP